MVLTRISLVIPLGMINIMQGTAQQLASSSPERSGVGYAPSGVLVGGTRQRRFDGTNSKPHKRPENAQTPTSRVHAVLGVFVVTDLLTEEDIVVHIRSPALTVDC